MSQPLHSETSLPLISIIMPVYNVRPYLNASINTALAQTYENLELLIVDDGSTDGSTALVKAAAKKDHRIRAFYRQNAGPSASRNFGLKNAKGKYIVFMDSDDVIDRRCLARMHETVCTYHTDLCLCGYTRFHGSQTLSCHRLHERGTLILGNTQEIASLFGCARTSLFGVSVWGKLYRASVIREFNISFPEEVHYEEDCCFNLQYMSHIQNASVLPELLYHWRQGYESLSKKYRPNAFPFLIGGYLKRMAFYESIGLADQQYLLSNIMVTVISTHMKKLAAATISRKQKRADIQTIIAIPEVQQIFNSTKAPRKFFSRKLKKYILTNDANRLERLLMVWRIKWASIDKLRKMKYYMKRLSSK